MTKKPKSSKRKGGPLDFTYVTPEQAFKLGLRDGAPLIVLQRLAKNRSTCTACGAPVWKLVNVGLCFACTTGESDASDDYELM